MNRLIPTLLFAAAMICLAESSVFAQMFGDRTFGQPLTRQSGSDWASGTMTSGDQSISGTNRMHYGPRRQDDFVGNDLQEAAHFVGRRAANTNREVLARRRSTPFDDCRRRISRSTRRGINAIKISFMSRRWWSPSESLRPLRGRWLRSCRNLFGHWAPLPQRPRCRLVRN